MALIPEENFTPSHDLASEIRDLAMNNRILEAECAQLSEFLTEALNELADLREEREDLRRRASHAEAERNRVIQREERRREEKGLRKTTWAVSELRAELRDSDEVLAKASKTIHDLAILSTSALGLVAEDPVLIAPILKEIDEARDSIETVLGKTSR